MPVMAADAACFAQLHPAYLLRSPNMKKQAFSDLLQLYQYVKRHPRGRKIDDDFAPAFPFNGAFTLFFMAAFSATSKELPRPFSERDADLYEQIFPCRMMAR